MRWLECEGLARAQRRTHSRPRSQRATSLMIAGRHLKSHWTACVIARSHSLPRFRTRQRTSRYPGKLWPGSSYHHLEGQQVSAPLPIWLPLLSVAERHPPVVPREASSSATTARPQLRRSHTPDPLDALMHSVSLMSVTGGLLRAAASNIRRPGITDCLFRRPRDVKTARPTSPSERLFTVDHR
jgi:hypothetical protein